MNYATRMAGVAAFLVCVGGLMCGSDDPGDPLGDGTVAVGDGGRTAIGPGTATGGCGSTCIHLDVGAGTTKPFDLSNHENAGVMIDPSGALVLDPSSTGIPNHIWIANTGAGTVTKVDTKTYKVLGRYAVGPSIAGSPTLDPSRTSVNAEGDVFVGNRAGGRLLKISAAGPKCPDTNKDGKITTSTGLNDVLPWGEDDCVLWEVPVPGETLVRGVAAQDLETVTPKPDDPFHVDRKHSVWTGGTTGRTVREYDGVTGALLISTASPTAIYGLAFDGHGQLYMSGNTDGNRFGRVDTTRCKDQASCDAAEICVTTCSDTGACVCTSCTSGPCDQAIKERIEVPDGVYGITVDYKQRVWLGGAGVKRYDPSAPASARYAKVTNDFFHGIAADAKGWIWAAGGASVRRVHGDTLAFQDVAGVSSKGMAVDRDGKIWAISLSDGANVIVPGPTITDNTVQAPAGGNAELGGSGPPTGLGYCYTYSDMTGQQLALATANPGYYRQVMDGCSSGDTTWFDLSWTANTPPGTTVSFYGRTAPSNAALSTAPWIHLVTTPPDSSPVSLAKAFGTAPLQSALELEVRLVGTNVNNTLVSPSVSKFGVTQTCAVKAK